MKDWDFDDEVEGSQIKGLRGSHVVMSCFWGTHSRWLTPEENPRAIFFAIAFGHLALY